MQDDGIERRVDTRKPLRTRVELALPTGQVVQARALDLGQGGIGLVTEVNLSVGFTCSVAFRLGFKDGSSYQVRSSARITYSVFSREQDGFKVGMQFSPPSAELAAALARYLGL